MAKQWVRNHEVQHDEVQDFIDRSIIWVASNRQTAAIVGGVLAAAILVAVLSVYRVRAKREDAWNRLGNAESLAYSGRGDSAMDKIKQLSVDHPGSDAAGFAAIFAGDIMFQRGQYKEAASQYEKVVAAPYGPRVLGPLALCDLALAQEAAGQPKEAAQTARHFLDAYSDHFLAPQAHACLARSLEAAGQSAEARTTLQKIVLQYPDTAWAAWAQARLKTS